MAPSPNRLERGYSCLPGIGPEPPSGPGTAALLRTGPPPRTVVGAAAAGRRHGGPEAPAAGIVRAAGAPGGIGRGLFHDLVERLRGDRR
ncbi:hypothetical protein SUDANB121_04789 [Nocardiopsis dassonvillei]|uniref:hypothetical protein n=1 Tax=Nocardiopsis dassonvillei TaxID=2014 RepID=UPI003F566398